MSVKYRKLVYQFAFVVALAAIAYGVFNLGGANEFLKYAGEVVALVASVLALLNLSPDKETVPPEFVEELETVE